MLPFAILDTSVLLVLYHLEKLEYLNLFYRIVRVPRAVEEEFLNSSQISEQEKSKQYDFLTYMYEKHGAWFKPCNEYNTDLVKIYESEKGIDRGEAEVFAQNQVFGDTHELLLDEKRARSFAEKSNYKFHGVLYILAIMDLRFKILDYFESVSKVKKELKTFLSDKIIRAVYNQTKRELGL